MINFMRRYWFLIPIVASLATQCDNESPRGAAPTRVTSATLILTSVPSPVRRRRHCAELVVFNHVRPSWRDNGLTSAYDPERVELSKTSPNVFTAHFNDVPVGVENSMTVHDINECYRDPNGDGRVTTGITLNGIPITKVLASNALLFTIDRDGVIKQ